MPRVMDQQGPQADEPGRAAPAAPPSLAPSPQAIHFVRTLQTITLGYSQMADQKASILMGATFVVFTIAVGQIRGGGLPVSLTVLALFAFASALCAIFAVLPSVGAAAKGTTPNKLFFGHYAATPEEEWVESIEAELPRDEAIYRLMLRDIHQNGVVLQRKKYRWLRLAYRTFMFGLSLTVVTFVCEMLGLFAAR
jgi:hypothetical protein